jgi:hypothetical protein
VRDLAYALFHDDRQPYRLAKEFVADLTAVHPIEHAGGFVIMKKSPLGGHSIDWGPAQGPLGAVSWGGIGLDERRESAA